QRRHAGLCQHGQDAPGLLRGARASGPDLPRRQERLRGRRPRVRERADAAPEQGPHLQAVRGGVHQPRPRVLREGQPPGGSRPRGRHPGAGEGGAEPPDRQAEHAILPDRAPRRGAARHVLLSGPRVPQALPGHPQGLARGRRRPRLARVLRFLPQAAGRQSDLRAEPRGSAEVLGPDQRPAVIAPMNVARRARALACVVLAAAPGAMAPATAPDEQAAPAAIVPLYVRPLTSNGGIGNYDLYVHELGGKTTRLTNHKEKDGQADWSPVADQLVFVSGRTGKGDLYLLDVASRGVTRLTWGTSPFLYPQWSPDGTKVTMLHGNNDNHD